MIYLLLEFGYIGNIQGTFGFNHLNQAFYHFMDCNFDFFNLKKNVV